jgi:aarF domain-containing kinase
MRFLKAGALLTTGSIIGFCYFGYAEYGIDPTLMPGAVLRSSRDIFAAGKITLDYMRIVRSEAYRNVEKDQDAKKKEELLLPVHKRSAILLRELFFKNAGIYIKIGQYLTQLQYVLPEPYVSEMMPMLDKAPTSSIEEVRQVVQEGLGKSIDEAFEEFDPVPIASASLAQVHKAKKKGTGEILAVKVQHNQLLETSIMDVMMIKMLIHALYRFYPNLDYRWLIQEVQDNLPKELNFLHEAENLERCRKNVSNIRNVRVPRVHNELCSKRVLTMDFEQGISLTNVEKLSKSGLDLNKIAKLISTVFCSQIFLHGFVHCKSF